MWKPPDIAPQRPIRRIVWLLLWTVALAQPGIEAPLRAEGSSDSTSPSASISAESSVDIAEDAGTVRGRLQTRPGGPMEDAEVPVRPRPDSFPAVPAAETTLDDDALVLGLVIGDEARAYPIRHLARYEVVGDRVADVAVAVTWCPFSASGTVFGREVEGRELSFDFVRGLIHDNLVISDRQTRSIWSQLEGRATDGPLGGRKLETLASMQTTWAFWKTRHPETSILEMGDDEGYPYRYFASAELRMPPVGAATHDTASLGLGLSVFGQAAFFPLAELAKAPIPFVVGSGALEIRIHHDLDGMTAWAESADGVLLPGQLVYARSWRDFHPESRIFNAALACDVR